MGIDLKLPQGVGLGLRYAFAHELLESEIKPDWVELAPENWMGRGGFFKKVLSRLRQELPVVCHGLSLSIGSPEAPDKDFLKGLKEFLNAYDIDIYSEHLSFSSLKGVYLHDLFPLPFTEELVRHVSRKISIVQDFLERPLILENISYYYKLSSELQEWEFINAVLEESGAYLLLDVNNVYVNSVNHGYDPYNFIGKLELSKVAYLHIAGHERFGQLLIDTHGAPVAQEVRSLLRFTLEKVGDVPILLERDNNIPEYKKLVEEVESLRAMYGACNR